MGRNQGKIKKACFNEQGSVLPLFGLILGAIVGVTGIAIDYGRAQMVQAKLHMALDAAGLAAGAVAKSRDINKEVRKFVEANFPDGYMETTYDVTEINVTENPINSSVTIDLRAQGEMKTSFMNVFSFSNVDIEASTEVIQARRRGFELVMVLDNSGSMDTKHSGISRRDSMVAAANDMLDMLYGTSNFYANMFVGLVPFSNFVNVGGAKDPGSKWLRANNTSTTSIVGDVNCTDENPTYIGSGTAMNPQSPAERNTAYAMTDQPPTEGTPDSLFTQSTVASTSCNVSAMTSMQNTKSDVRTALDGMKAAGNTRVDLGAVWGWRMLSPRWRDKWTHEGPSLPLNYHSEDMDKVAIILTDGENNPSANTISRAQADANLLAVCNAMKHEGVYVYTVGFCLTDASTQGLLKQCATSVDHYSWACGNSSIRDVFKKIADSLMNLRISR